MKYSRIKAKEHKQKFHPRLSLLHLYKVCANGNQDINGRVLPPGERKHLFFKKDCFGSISFEMLFRSFTSNMVSTVSEVAAALRPAARMTREAHTAPPVLRQTRRLYARCCMYLPLSSLSFRRARAGLDEPSRLSFSPHTHFCVSPLDVRPSMTWRRPLRKRCKRMLASRRRCVRECIFFFISNSSPSF